MIFYQLADLQAISPGIVKYSTMRALEDFKWDIDEKETEGFIKKLLEKLCIPYVTIESHNDTIKIIVKRSSCPFKLYSRDIEERYCFIPFIIIDALRRRFGNRFLLKLENKKILSCNDKTCFFEIIVYEKEKTNVREISKTD